MTPEHLSPEAFAALGGPNLVYVRPVKGAELLADTPLDEFRGIPIEPDQVLYALHGVDGARLAITSDKETAVATARANELAVVSVH